MTDNHTDLQKKYLESEQRFQGAFETAAIGMALVAPDGAWLEVNKSLCDMVGYSKDELMNKTFQDITHPDDLDADLEYVKQMLDDKIQTYQMEKRYFHKSGRIVWILLSVSLVRDENNKPLYFVSQISNITKRKLLEYEMEVKLEEFQLLVGNLTDVVSRHDSFAVYTYVTPSVKAVLGYKPSELIGKSAYDLFHKDDIPNVQKSHAADLKANEVNTVVYRIRRKDGEYIWFESTHRAVYDDEGKIREIIVVSRDITERKNLEERLEYALQGARDGLWDWLIQDDKVFFSPRWKEMLGYKDKEINNVFAEWEKLLHPDDLVTAKKYIDDFFKNSDSDDYEQIFRMRRKDGDYATILSRGHLIRDVKGKPYRMVGTHTDISAQKKLEFTLKAKIDELEKINSVAVERELKMIELKKEIEVFKKTQTR
ncbi:MAG: PAS domain S-box protein [Patescibacteria group bacterium]